MFCWRVLIILWAFGLVDQIRDSPCVLLALAVIILVCMIVNFANWQNYLTMQIFMVLFSLGYLIYSVVGRGGNRILAWIVFGTYLTLWVMTMILGGRKAENEVRRKFHL